jgi:hypothetical protein
LEGDDRPLNPPAKHIAVADTKYQEALSGDQSANCLSQEGPAWKNSIVFA